MYKHLGGFKQFELFSQCNIRSRILVMILRQAHDVFEEYKHKIIVGASYLFTIREDTRLNTRILKTV